MAKTISFVKGKGSLRHNNREFIANNIDETRVPWNTVYIQKPLQEVYKEIFGNAVSEYNAKQKRSDRKIDDYLTKIKNSGNNEKQFYETVIQIGKRDDTGVLDENGNLSEEAKVTRDILDEYARTFQERNSNLILFNAVLHMDETTPHLHMDYIPVAHGYKTGLSTRNSLTKGLQEMGIAPAVSKSDTETMHWQERERAYISELCKEHEIEIEVLGVDRDSYNIPEYKKAMREKEAAEAEIEILNAEKMEVEAVIENMDRDLESGQMEIEEQKESLKEITDQISDAEKKVAAKEKTLDKILDAGKPVEKEISEIRAQVSGVANFFGGEPMVKLPKKTFERMISRYRVAGTFENLNRQYASAIEAKDKTIAGLKEQVSSLKSKVREFTDFLSEHGLMEAFKEFIRPKSLKEKLEIGKRKSREMEIQKKNLTVVTDKKHDIAI